MPRGLTIDQGQDAMGLSRTVRWTLRFPRAGVNYDTQSAQ